MSLQNNGELNTMQKRSLRDHLRGYATGWEHASGVYKIGEKDLQEEAFRFVMSDYYDNDFKSRSFGNVMNEVNKTIDEIMEIE